MERIDSLLKATKELYPKVSFRDLRLLLAHVLQKPLEFLLAHPEVSLSISHKKEFENKVEALAAHTPLTRILGYREFWSLNFKLSPHTLDPRPDSETLIEAVLKQVPKRGDPLRILDLGTGTGCLLLSLLTEYPKASGVAVDISKEALKTAQENAKSFKLESRTQFLEGSWFSPLNDKFDVIISNPPYLSDFECQHLPENVRLFDPEKALKAGRDGLDCYKEIIKEAPFYLSPQGMLVLEVGHTQKDLVQDLLHKNGFKYIQVYKDLSSIDRCLVARV